MRGIRMVGRDTGNLTDEELLFIYQEIVGAAWPKLKAREVFEMEPIDSIARRAIRLYTETDMGSAMISIEGEAINLDRTQLTKGTDIKVPVIHKEFTINWRDLGAKRDFTESLDLREARNAARQVAEVENRLCFSGETTAAGAAVPPLGPWYTYGINGLLDSVPGANVVGCGAWPANVVANMNTAIALLEGAGFEKPFVAILPVGKARKLDVIIGAGGAGMTHRKFLLENDIVQGIISDNGLVPTDGGVLAAPSRDSGLIVCPGKDNFSLMVARDITVHTAPLPNMNLFGRIYEVAVPVIKRPAALAELNNIT